VRRKRWRPVQRTEQVKPSEPGCLVGPFDNGYVQWPVTPTAPSKTQLADDLRDVRRKLEQLAAEGPVSDVIDLVIELLARMRDTNNALRAAPPNPPIASYGYDPTSDQKFARVRRRLTRSPRNS
jgi:hypothetical protein